MNEKKEINIRAIEFGLRTSLELYKDMKNGVLTSPSLTHIMPELVMAK